MEHFHTEAFPDPLEYDSEQGGFLRFVVDVFETLLLSLILFLVINAISARIRVDGMSMEPTLQTGEYVIVNKLSYRVDDPEHGDIVVFHFPRNPQDEYIKRVIGLPGDEVQIEQGTVLVNGIVLDEPYISSDPSYSGTWTVPADALFVLGDNRNNSSDSHSWGWVPMEFVIGKAVFVYWPPTNWGIIEQPTNALAAP